MVWAYNSMALLLWVALLFYYCSVPIALLFYQEGSIPYRILGNIQNRIGVVVLSWAILLVGVGVGEAPTI